MREAPKPVVSPNQGRTSIVPDALTLRFPFPLFNHRKKFRMFKMATALLAINLLLAGGNALAQDAMKQDTMKKDEMSKDAMGKDATPVLPARTRGGPEAPR